MREGRLGRNLNRPRDGEEGKKRAVALKYRIGKDRAPIVVAKGSGKRAERILSLAEDHNVPIHQDEGLSLLLMKVELNQAIPPELYQVVAEVLSLIYRLEKKAESLREVP